MALKPDLRSRMAAQSKMDAPSRMAATLSTMAAAPSLVLLSSSLIQFSLEALSEMRNRMWLRKRNETRKSEVGFKIKISQEQLAVTL
ncbi:unnamed protein product [Arabidopsis lyrata]|nr:unnamed protein product [Arabidopsis lyrata]